MAADVPGSPFDPYATLGVSRLAGVDEIHRAYRGLAKELHPDHNPGDAASAAHFARVADAYELLTDDMRRRAYDLATAATQGPRASRLAPAPTGNTTVRGPGARPSHRPIERREPAPDPTDWAGVAWQLVKWFAIGGAVLFVAIAAIAYATGQG